jgi:bisphosphoglycerate-dependent phosphoglycerate mutase
MAKLFLQRHFKSQWNKLNIWAGWCDNPLSDVGRAQAPEAAEKIGKEKIDVIYVGSLIRNLETVLCIYEFIPDCYPLFKHPGGGKMEEWGHFTGNAGNYIPAIVTDAFNERFY